MGKYPDNLTTWEKSLLSKANAFRHTTIRFNAKEHFDREQLEAAYACCARITFENSRTFYMASALMPAPKRRAIRALYAFCRSSDDIVDKPDSNGCARLQTWRVHLFDAQALKNNPVLMAWCDTVQQYQIPLCYIEHLLDGIAQDLTVHRYATFEELAHYCYGVASTVGLMSMYIIGFEDPQATLYAIKLGVALQLTNILRDVGEDWQRGRLYLPLEELRVFGLDENDVAAGQVDDRWRAFMRFQIHRTRRLYRESLPGIVLLHPQGQLAVAAAAKFYQAILDDIEAHDYDVFNHRAYVPDTRKLMFLPGITWHTYLMRCRQNKKEKV